MLSHSLSVAFNNINITIVRIGLNTAAASGDYSVNQRFILPFIWTPQDFYAILLTLQNIRILPCILLSTQQNIVLFPANIKKNSAVLFVCCPI